MSHESRLHDLSEQIIWLLSVPLLTYFFCVAGTLIDFQIIRNGAVAVGAIGASCIVATHLAGIVARLSRTALVWCFTPLTFTVLVGMGVATIGQVALLAGLAVSMKIINSGTLMFLAALAFGAFCACETLWESFAKLRARGASIVVGHKLTRESSPKLFAAIDEMAERLHSRSPDCVLISQEPEFAIFAGPARLMGSEHIIDGITLLISASIMRALTVDEFRAILAHELAHYRGRDLDYGRSFLPIYARLRRTVTELSDNRMVGIARFGRMPALVALKACLLGFARVERRFSRERELAADRASAKVVGSLAAACALVKYSLYAPLWGTLREAQIAQLKQGKYISRLSSAYDDLCRRVHNDMDLQRTLDHHKNTRQPHPFDTHPTLQHRLRNLRFDYVALSKQQLGLPEVSSSCALLEDHQSLDEHLSSLDAGAMVAFGHVELPKASDLDVAELQEPEPSPASNG